MRRSLTGSQATRQRGEQARRSRAAGVPSSARGVGTGARRAFTLVEMLVSLGVLAVVLAIIGVVFVVTTNTTRQAAAYSEAQRWVRQFTDQLAQDLRQIDPSNSVLVLVGRTVPAALTPADIEAGRFYRVLVGDPRGVQPPNYDPATAPAVDTGGHYSDPRADILLFITNRETASQAPPPNPTPGTVGQAAARGARFSPTLALYGHASFADPVWTGTGYQYPNPGQERHIQQMRDRPAGDCSILPANQWHLSRRATSLHRDPRVLVPGLPNTQLFPAARTRLPRCEWYSDAGHPMPGDAAYFDLPFFLETLGPDYFTPSPAGADPYNFPNYPWTTSTYNSIHSLLYAATEPQPPRNYHVTTVIPNPPAELASNLGVHLLPGCAWFQVEFLMPEDPRNSVEYAPAPAAGVAQRTDMPRWTAVEDGRTYVFVPDAQANRDAVMRQVDQFGVPLTGSRLARFAQVIPPSMGGENNAVNRKVRMWPYAIRVTVRVFDPQGRLREPIERSVIYRFE